MEGLQPRANVRRPVSFSSLLAGRPICWRWIGFSRELVQPSPSVCCVRTLDYQAIHHPTGLTIECPDAGFGIYATAGRCAARCRQEVLLCSQSREATWISHPTASTQVIREAGTTRMAQSRHGGRSSTPRRAGRSEARVPRRRDTPRAPVQSCASPVTTWPRCGIGDDSPDDGGAWRASRSSLCDWR
jgi:hypothetical protein